MYNYLYKVDIGRMRGERGRGREKKKERERRVEGEKTRGREEERRGREAYGSLERLILYRSLERHIEA